MKKIFLILLLIIVVLIIITVAIRQPTKLVIDGEVDEFVGEYIEESAEELKKIFEKSIIVQADVFEDGGTACVLIEDDKKQSFFFCRDRRLLSQEIREYFYLGYPGDENSKRFPYKGKEEEELLKFLKRGKYINKDTYTEITIDMLIAELEERLF